MSKQRTKENGTKNDEWETPDYVFKVLDEEFTFNMDLCATFKNAKTLDHSTDALNYEPHQDGLSIWCNPPYSNPLKDKIIKKCYELSLSPKVNQVVMIIPAATETRSFHNIIWKYAHEIRLIDKRVRFKGYNTKGEYVTNKTGQSGSMIIVFKKRNSYDNPFVTTQKFTRGEINADDRKFI